MVGLGPSQKMGGFQSGRSLEKQGIWELKITKKLNHFKTRVFSICPGRKSGTKNCIFLKRGSFGAAHVEKVESLGATKAEIWGVFARHIPVLSLYGITPHPRVPTYRPSMNILNKVNKQIFKLGHTYNSEVVKLNSERKQSTDSCF